MFGCSLYRLVGKCNDWSLSVSLGCDVERLVARWDDWCVHASPDCYDAALDSEDETMDGAIRVP